ncbi:TonB-dependent siderophore receptor [Paracoccus sp. PAR01]|uniref:TonB-dependent siderophore receptor n=1 Tax=Paracoccus sp. PAR01 TaxID=2769282 RepID=UPI001784775C|nr:TonB-dependent siderophore receptor [Paracoccus sp. PAR01]MBD9528591.1 TonB-dependent siderophore receptor [Paracoccus sp. PAR01]
MKRKAAALSTAMGIVASAAAAQVVKLDTIVLEADVAETASSYALPEMRSATKTDTPVVETPQALTVVTRKQFDDQNTQTVGQALRYTSGVLSEIDASTRYDSVFLRGFGGFGTSSQFVGFLDGLRLPRGQGFAQSAIDPFLLDRVDVLKGPSALLYGQSGPGGLVNMVSRSPDGSTGGEARLEFGNHDRVQAGFAQQGVLDEEGTLQYSVSAMGRVAGSRYDHVDEDRFAIAPNLVWTPSDQTRLTVGAYWQKDPEGGYFNSIYPTQLAPEFAGDLDRDLNVGDPNFDSFEREQWGVYAGIEHLISPSLTLRSKLRFSGVDADMQGIQMAAPISPEGVLTRLAVRSHEEVRGFAWDSNLEYGLRTGAAEHRLLAGVDLQWNESDWQYEYTLAPPLDVTNPVYAGVSGPFFPLTDSKQTVRQNGVYLSDQITMGRLHAVLGARYDWIETESENRLAGATTKQDSEAASYRAALLYHFDNGAAPYLSYATSFEPVIGVDAAGQPFEPTRAKQWELGLKYQPQDVEALFTVAAFDIRQENVLTPGEMPGFSQQTGEIRSRGLEFEARGQVTPQLEVIAAYTLLDTEIARTTVPGVEGNRPQAVPEHFGSIWLNYAFAGAMEGFELGGGVRMVGSSYGDDANELKSDGYTLVDLAMRQDIGATNPALEGLEATLNVRNLLDETYYSSCSYNFYCQYGEGRTITAGLRKTW